MHRSHQGAVLLHLWFPPRIILSQLGLEDLDVNLIIFKSRHRNGPRHMEHEEQVEASSPRLAEHEGFSGDFHISS